MKKDILKKLAQIKKVAEATKAECILAVDKIIKP